LSVEDHDTQVSKDILAPAAGAVVRHLKVSQLGRIGAYVLYVLEKGATSELLR
jgi:hypothetical protein